jgi:hypothetical protein
MRFFAVVLAFTSFVLVLGEITIWCAPALPGVSAACRARVVSSVRANGPPAQACSRA